MENVVRKLQGKTAVITGCSRGIGRGILNAMANNGANIIACMRREDETTNSEFQKLSDTCGVTILPLYFDLSDHESIKEGIKAIKAFKMPIDILVNNAGTAHLGLVPFTRLSDLQSVFQINYFAHFQIVQGLYGLLTKSRGCIINMASAAGMDGEMGNAVYGATKASMILFTKVLSKEMAEAGVRVNAIAPGMIETDFADKMGESAKKSMIQSSLFHRLGRVEEVAKTAVFLASKDASFITGQVIRVDGGLN